MWAVYKQSNRPWPQLSEDPLIDFQIMEAVAVRYAEAEKKAQKEQERANWKKDKEGLSELRSK